MMILSRSISDDDCMSISCSIVAAAFFCCEVLVCSIVAGDELDQCGMMGGVCAWRYGKDQVLPLSARQGNRDGSICPVGMAWLGRQNGDNADQMRGRVGSRQKGVPCVSTVKGSCMPAWHPHK
jgi:hypothetical protein